MHYGCRVLGGIPDVAVQPGFGVDHIGRDEVLIARQGDLRVNDISWKPAL